VGSWGQKFGMEHWGWKIGNERLGLEDCGWKVGVGSLGVVDLTVEQSS